jgi:hypothetical protein
MKVAGIKLTPAHLLVFAGFGLALSNSRGPADDRVPLGEEKAKRSSIGAAFFADPTVHVFDLNIPEPQLSQLGRYSQNYVTAEIREGETVLRDVGVRLKGNGSFRSIDQKPSFAIKFDEKVEGQPYRA